MRRLQNAVVCILCALAMGVAASEWCTSGGVATSACLPPAGDSLDKHEQVSSKYEYNACKLREKWPAMSARELPCALPALHGLVEKKATMSESTTLHLTPIGAQKYIDRGLPVYGRCQVPLLASLSSLQRSWNCLPLGVQLVHAKA